MQFSWPCCCCLSQIHNFSTFSQNTPYNIVEDQVSHPYKRAAKTVIFVFHKAPSNITLNLHYSVLQLACHALSWRGSFSRACFNTGVQAQTLYYLCTGPLWYLSLVNIHYPSSPVYQSPPLLLLTIPHICRRCISITPHHYSYTEVQYSSCLVYGMSSSRRLYSFVRNSRHCYFLVCTCTWLLLSNPNCIPFTFFVLI